MIQYHPEFMIGADPEVFVTSKGKLVSAHGLIPGDKRAPHKVPTGAIQVDGMALEFNIDPISLSERGKSHFATRITSVLASLYEYMKQSDPDADMLIEGSVVFDEEYYNTVVPESAKELGCDPDFNAWEGGAQNPAPEKGTPLRGAAGHIHIGWGEDIPVDHPDHIAMCCDFVKCLDFYLGLGTTLYETKEGMRRKEAYGKAGAFRPKTYGVEYRTPSNCWITNGSKKRFVFDLAAAAISDMKRGDSAYWKRAVAPSSNVINVQAIINGDRNVSWCLNDPILENIRNNHTIPPLEAQKLAAARVLSDWLLVPRASDGTGLFSHFYGQMYTKGSTRG